MQTCVDYVDQSTNESRPKYITKKFSRPTFAMHILTRNTARRVQHASVSTNGIQVQLCVPVCTTSNFFQPQSRTCFGPDLPVDNRAPHTDSVHAECEGVISTPFAYFTKSVQTRFRSNRSGPAVYAASRNPSPPAVVPHGPYLFIPIWWRCAAP